MTQASSPQVSPARGYLVLAVAIGINLILGSLYAWSIVGKALVGPKGYQYGWTQTEANMAFATATAAFALTMIFAGRVQDKIGPRMITMVGGVLLGTAMMLSSYFTASPPLLCLTFGVLGGVGIGLGYAATTPATMKWFHPSQKGLIAGLVVAGIGLASAYMAPLTMHLIDYYKGPAPATQPAKTPAATTPAMAAAATSSQPVSQPASQAATKPAGPRVIKENPPVAQTLLTLGLGTAIVVPLLGLLLINPPAGYTPRARAAAPGAPKPSLAQRPNRDWNEVLTTPQFYLLWVTFILAASPGLMVLVNAAAIADTQVGAWDFPGPYAGLKWLLRTLGVLLVVTMALANTCGRVVAGFTSDRIGRTNAMILFFVLQAVNMFCFARYQSAELLLFGVVACGLCYGAIFTLMPAAMADFFGVKNLGVNYGLLFTAFGVAGTTGSLLGGRVKDLIGSFDYAYIAVAVMLLVAAVLAFLTRAPATAETVTVPLAGEAKTPTKTPA